MLKPYKHFYWTNSINPPAMHLGDQINIYQQMCKLNGLKSIYSETICPCCGNKAEEVFQLLTELNPIVKYGKLHEIPYNAVPCWFKEHKTRENIPYTKALVLPKRSNHIAVQIDSRSRGKKIPSWITKALKLVKRKINIGDRPLDALNATDVSLKEKFEIIASARYYVGIDSGLTHLALMTNTPIILVHPTKWNVNNYYAETPQITKIDDYDKFLELEL